MFLCELEHEMLCMYSLRLHAENSAAALTSLHVKPPESEWTGYKGRVCIAYPSVCSMTSGAIQQGVPTNVLRDIC